MSEAAGTVYLLHYERPFHGPMRHYLGWTTDLDKRLADHRRGTGAVTTRRAVEQGIAFELVRTWPGGPDLERRLKTQGAQTNACPRCGRADRRGDAHRSDCDERCNGDWCECPCHQEEEP